MDFKKNYFLRNMVDLEINSLSEYLEGADYNYVIFEKNVPIIWGSDKTPVIYGGETDVYAELDALCALKEDGVSLKEDFKVMTEQDFIETFCLDAVAEYLYKKVMNVKYFDGVNYMLHFDNSFNGIVNINGMTDILNIYCDETNKNVNFLISDENDVKQDFCYLGDFPFDVIIKIVKYVEHYSNDKIFVLTEVDVQNYGYNAKSIYLFKNKEKAQNKLYELYIKAFKKYYGNEVNPLETSNNSEYQYENDYAYINGYYYLDIFEKEIE